MTNTTKQEKRNVVTTNVQKVTESHMNMFRHEINVLEAELQKMKEEIDSNYSAEVIDEHVEAYNEEGWCTNNDIREYMEMRKYVMWLSKKYNLIDKIAENIKIKMRTLDANNPSKVLNIDGISITKSGVYLDMYINEEGEKMVRVVENRINDNNEMDIENEVVMKYNPADLYTIASLCVDLTHKFFQQI